MKFYIALGLFCLTLVSVTSAGPVSLDGDQMILLRKILDKDPEAKAQFSSLAKIANNSVSQQPAPVPVLIGEGKLNADLGKIKSDIALKDMEKIYSLAWVGVISDNSTFIAKGIYFINTWAKVNHSDGDPINETKLEPLVVAYDILRPQFTPQDRDFVDHWLHSRALTLWNDPRHHTENWQSHRLKMVGLIATVIKDEALWKAVEDGFKSQMNVSFLADGSSTDFKLRDAMHYHLYSVLPLLTLACAAHQRNHDWYDYQAPSGASLRKAIDFIKPYADGEKSHMEFSRSSVAFDKIRANAGEGEYAPHVWSKCDAGPIYSEASCVDASSASNAVNSWCGVKHKHFVNWSSVINSVKLKK